MRMTMGDHFRNIRKKLCLSQAELARFIHVTPSSMCRYEQNIIRPSCATMRKVVKFCNEHDLNITYEDFINSMEGANDDEQIKKAG